MIPVIPRQRQFKAQTRKRFNDLLKYLQGVVEQGQEGPQPITGLFSDIIDYATEPLTTGVEGEKCIAIRTHGVNGIETASIEMNAVSMRNHRCADPVFHFILSWPEHERPIAAEIFDAAEHALRALGMEEHQYVLAVHANTDNLHCHIAVNRVHPTTFKSHHIQWAKRTLHFAARESEIKHGWSHDNGIYVVHVDGHGKKHIVLGRGAASPEVQLGEAGELEPSGVEAELSTWHDSESLESWLKKDVAKALKKALPGLQSWQGLHLWLEQRRIELQDTGGGGLRLRTTSAETGEVVDLPLSRGLRILRRPELEAAWGRYIPPLSIDAESVSLAHLTQADINHGVEHVLNLDGGQRPPEHVLRRAKLPAGASTQGVHSLPAMPDRSMDGQGRGEAEGGSPVLLPRAVHDGLEYVGSGERGDVRRPRAGPNRGGGEGEPGGLVGRRAGRDPFKRAAQRELRKEQRLDLRRRFATYRNLVRDADSTYFGEVARLRAEKRRATDRISLEQRAARASVLKQVSSVVDRQLSLAVIHDEAVRQRLLADDAYQRAFDEVKKERALPLSWRAWLHEQSKRGDRAALSALRGIVYQAQRDAKGERHTEEIDEEDESRADYADEQYKRFLKRLLEEEQREVAIRAARLDMARPHEMDVLLRSYTGLLWSVTGNGNVQYTRQGGAAAFNDRGNRVTFDRVLVTDEDILLALVHSREKFGRTLTLTGSDPVFLQRMAKLADDLGIKVLNPDLQGVIAVHREERHTNFAEALMADARAAVAATFETNALGPSTAVERVQGMVLSIDPHAHFVDAKEAALRSTRLVGNVVATLEESGGLVAQHIGRHRYVVHALALPPGLADGELLTVEYQGGAARLIETGKDASKER